MGKTDWNLIKKVKNGQPAPGPISAPSSCSNRDGLLRVLPSPGMSHEEAREMQAHHNINHALFYFSMMTYSIIRTRRRWPDEKKARRIIQHLSCAREFLTTGEKEEADHAVKSLLEHLADCRPASTPEWTYFLYMNWNSIQVLARLYGGKVNSFTDEAFQRIRDLVNKKHFWRGWWWGEQIEKMKIKFSRWAARKRQ